MKRKPWHVMSVAIGLCALVMALERATSGQEAPADTPPQEAQLAPQVPQRPPQIPEVAPPEPDRTLQDAEIRPPDPVGPPQDAAETPQEEEVTPLERGPVHEAFAEPIVLDAQPDLLVKQQPPEPVPELPPDTRPEGDNVVWIPGYWTWSEDMDDFIWVSGVWRDVPPGHEWVPGYWDETPEGFRWIHGFWRKAEAAELLYLPEPPQSLETGPPSPQPGPDYFYIPGCWKWNAGTYAWRPGFWHPIQPNWIWIPARYYYTPRGYIYLSGYWDYPLYRRGLLFAPVHFHRPLYLRRGFFFTPFVAVHIPLLTHGLFIAPHRRHYYFGPYYGARFRSRGFYPWFDYHHHRFGYDPLFVHASWHHRGNQRQWLDGLRNEYRRFGDFDGDGPRDLRRGPDRIADRGPDTPRGSLLDRDRERVDRDRGLDRDRVRGLGGERDRADTPRFLRNLNTIRGENERLARLTDEQRRRAAEQSTEVQERLRSRRTQLESQPGRRDAPFRGRIAGDGIGDRRPGDGVDDRLRRGRSDATQPDRSARHSFGDRRDGQPRTDEPRTVQPRDRQPRVDEPRVTQPRDRRPGGDRLRDFQPRTDQPRRDQPRIAQPRGDQPRTVPDSRSERVIRPDVRRPEARVRPEIGQPRTTERIAPRGSTVPSPRGQTPGAHSRSFSPQPRQSPGNFSGRDRINRGSPFGSGGPAFSPQPRQSPGGFSGRGGINRGGGPPSGGAARGISPGRGPSINRGGGGPPSRGGGGREGGGRRGR